MAATDLAVVAPQPVAPGSAAGGSSWGQSAVASPTALDTEWEDALNLKFSDRARYMSAEHQAKLKALAAAKTGFVPEHGGEDARQAAVSIIAGLQEALEVTGSWTNLSDSFDALPEVVASAVYSELMDPPPYRRAAASPETLARLASDSAGRAFLQDAGRDAPQRAARLCERMGRISARITDPAAWDTLAGWFDDLDAADAATIMKAIAR